MLPWLQVCSGRGLSPRRSRNAILLSSSCDRQPTQSSRTAGSFVSLDARRRRRRSVVWWGTLCGCLEKRKQREHGVDGHMGALSGTAGLERRAQSGRGVTWSGGLQVSSKRRAPSQRRWYTRANGPARQRARSSSGDALRRTSITQSNAVKRRCAQAANAERRPEVAATDGDAG